MKKIEMTLHQLNDFEQLVGDLSEIITFKIDDNDVRSNAKMMIANLNELIKKLRGLKENETKRK